MGIVLIFLSPIKYHKVQPELLLQRIQNQGHCKEMNECEQSILTVPQLTTKFFRFERRIRYETSGKETWVAENVTKQTAIQLKPSNVLSPLFAQPMHTNYYKVVKQLKSFKIIIVVPTCFGLHKPSSGCSQTVLSVLWLHMQPQYRLISNNNM